MINKRIFGTTVVILFVACIGGCVENESTAIREMARQTVREQAAQNQRLADATKELVSAEATARKSMLANHQNLQQQLQRERSQLDSRKSELDELRTEIELDRRRAPIIADAIFAVGGILGCLCSVVVGGLHPVLRQSQLGCRSGTNREPGSDRRIDTQEPDIAAGTNRHTACNRKWSPGIGSINN